METERKIEVIDSHAHLDGPEFDADRSEVLERARQAGVTEIVVVGAAGDMETAQRTVKIAQDYGHIHATVGIHPHDVEKIQDGWLEQLKEMARDKVVVAIGETGLDFFYDHSPREKQTHYFREFIRMAKELHMPVICHVRDAHEEAKAVIKEEDATEFGAVIHCFTGTPEDASDYVELGCYVSFSGIVTFKGKKCAPLREAVRRVPLDRILIETDCPYLAPVPNRGKRNEPAFVVHTGEVVAREAGISFTDLAKATVANTRSFFSLTEA